MGLFDFIGKGINSVTDALAGVRFFPGNVLGSETAGGMARDAREAQQQQKEQWDWLRNYGQQMLYMPSAGGMQTPSNQEGAGAATNAGASGSSASAKTSVSSAFQGQVPLTDVVGRYLSNVDAMTSGTDLQGYNLNPNQQKLLNQMLGQVSVQRGRALSSAKQQLANRGITSGPLYDATMRRLADHYDEQVMSASTQFAENARNQSLQESYQYLQQLMSQINTGTNLASQGITGGQGWANYLGNEAAAKQAEQAQSQQRLAAALATLAAGKFSASGVPWSIGGDWTANRTPTTGDVLQTVPNTGGITPAAGAAQVPTWPYTWWSQQNALAPNPYVTAPQLTLRGVSQPKYNDKLLGSL